MVQKAAVLGAGVAGLSTALYLRRAGCAVTVIDPLPPAGGASFGNAGLLSPDSVVPLALPGMLKKVPRWMLDPLGPLAIRPLHVPRAAPWLLRWIAASRPGRVRAISDALRALHRDAFDVWADLIGPAGMQEFVRRAGQVYAWESPAPAESGGMDAELRQRHGVRAESLGEDDLRQMFPGIARSVVRGLLLPDNGHTVNPGRMVQRLADLLQAEGGLILAERAMKLLPQEGGGWLVMTNIGNHRVDAVVVAAGAWSNGLLSPLGIQVPLQAERGYHAFLPDPSIPLRMPISFKNRGFALTPMEGGLRAAGTVEIDALEAPPDERRVAILERHVQEIFPGLQSGTTRLWMGSRPGTPDSLPVLGAVPTRPGLFLCLGHGHFGMTGGPPSGKLVAASVMGAPTTIDLAPYAIGRFHR